MPTSAFRRTLAGAVLACALAACHDSTGSKPLAELSVTAPHGTVDVGQTLLLTASGTDEGGAAVADPRVQWSTTNAAIASVKGGVVTGVAPGQATITATGGGKQADFQVTVEEAGASLWVDSTAVTLGVGAWHAVITRLSANGGEVLAGHSVYWTSSAPSVAAVDDSGVVHGLAAGSATVTATAGALRVQVPFTVVPPAYSAAVLAPPAAWPEAEALGLNAAGDVAGRALDAAGRWHAVAWTHGTAAVLDTAASVAYALNGTGQVVGAAGNRAAMWQAGARTWLVDDSAGYSMATDINTAGDVAGGAVRFYGTSSCGRYCDARAFRVHAGQLAWITTSSGSGVLGHFAINAAGDVAGTLDHWGETWLPFVYHAGQVSPVTSGLGLGAVAGATDIDSAGRVVGYVLNRAYLWQNGTSTLLAMPPGYGYEFGEARANALNAGGEVVGDLSVGYNGGFGGRYGFQWKAGTMRNLAELTAGDWIVMSATGINDAGQISAIGRNRITGKHAALLLTPH